MSRINGITGIHMDHVDRLLVVKSLQAKGIEVGEDDTVDQLAMSLHCTYDALPKSEKVRCVRCKAISSEKDDDSCPFCGHDTADPVEDEKPGKPAKKSEGAAPVAPSAAPKEEEKEKVMTTAETTSKKEQKLVKVNGKGKPAAVAVVERQEKDLDAAVKRVQHEKSASSSSMWRLGREIADIVDNQLWKLRKDDADNATKDKSRWPSFDAFCLSELGMTPKNAHSLVDIARQFSEENVKTFGTAKLGLILTAPPADQPKLLEQAGKGASKREIAESVKKAKTDAGHTRAARDKSTRGAASTPKAKHKPEKSKITVASIIGAHTVKLYKMPATMKGGVDFAEIPRAKKLGDIPMGKLDLANDVTLWAKISEDSAGNLVLKLNFKREE